MNRHERRAQKARNKKPRYRKPAMGEERAVLRAMVRIWLEDSGADKLPGVAALPPNEAVDGVLQLIDRGYARMAYDGEKDGRLMNLRLELTVPDTGEVVA